MTESNDPNRTFKPERKASEKLLLPSGNKTAILCPLPSLHSIALGESLVELSQVLKSEPRVVGEYVYASEDLERFQKNNRLFIQETSLDTLSCSQAVKRWALERLPPLKLSYEIKNRLNAKQADENADSLASRKLLELVEDFFQISSFCRDLDALQIEMAPHAAGMEFLFEFLGTCDRQEKRAIEDKGLNVLFTKYSRENSMRLRANVSDEFVEIQVVVFKKQLRLGMSPRD